MSVIYDIGMVKDISSLKSNKYSGMKTKILFNESDRLSWFKLLLVGILITTLVLLMNGCQKIDDLRKKGDGQSSAKATYNVRMTDAPGDFTEVNVDIRSVVIVSSKGGEITLNTKAGVYNLLDFQNGKDTLLATAGIEAGTISQIRLVLGNNNTVVVDSMTYPLTVPSGSSSGLKLQVHQSVAPGITYNVLLDFDANQSIVKTGNGKYLLKPVIRTIDSAISGSIKGTIIPVGVSGTVTATDSSNNSFSTNIDVLTGTFLLKGLPAGTYTVTITPSLPYNQQTISGVQVDIGKATIMAAINL